MYLGAFDLRAQLGIEPGLIARIAKVLDVIRNEVALRPGSTDARIPGGLERLRCRLNRAVVCWKHDPGPWRPVRGDPGGAGRWPGAPRASRRASAGSGGGRSG